MARDEEARPGGGDFLFGVRRVFTRVATHVIHVDLDAGTVPVEVFGDLAADVRSVDIAVDTAERLKCLKTIEDSGSEVTGVPDFIARSEVSEDCFIEKAVRV
jgi:hypothetical protein